MVPKPGSPVTESEEGPLLERLREGDRTAFEYLVRTYSGRLRAAALRVLDDEGDADDALQEAFLAAYRSIGGFRAKSRVGSWLHRIVLNCSLMKLRAKHRRPEVEIESCLPEFHPRGAFLEHQIAWCETPDSPAMKKEICEQVRSFIADLPEKYRTPLLLRDIEGLSNKEVAHELGLTANATKIRIHRARQALRSALEPSMRLES